MTYQQGFYVAVLRDEPGHAAHACIKLLAGPFQSGDEAATHVTKCINQIKNKHIENADDHVNVIGVYMPRLPDGVFNAALWIQRTVK